MGSFCTITRTKHLQNLTLPAGSLYSTRPTGSMNITDLWANSEFVDAWYCYSALSPMHYIYTIGWTKYRNLTTHLLCNLTLVAIVINGATHRCVRGGVETIHLGPIEGGFLSRGDVPLQLRDVLLVRQQLVLTRLQHLLRYWRQLALFAWSKRNERVQYTPITLKLDITNSL